MSLKYEVLKRLVKISGLKRMWVGKSTEELLENRQNPGIEGRRLRDRPNRGHGLPGGADDPQTSHRPRVPVPDRRRHDQRAQAGRRQKSAAL